MRCPPRLTKPPRRVLLGLALAFFQLQASCRETVRPLSQDDAALDDGQGSEGSSKEPWGTVTGEYKGVTAYSNGLSHGTEGTPRGTYGWQYQCVEYVNRFYVVALSHSGYTCGDGNMRGCGHAKDYYRNAGVLNLDAFPNGSSTPPLPDDILVFAGNEHGHVAIIRQVSPDGVRLIQQNWNNNTSDNDVFVSMTVTNGAYTVANLTSAYSVIGWLRRPSVTTGAPVIGLSPTSFNFSGQQGGGNPASQTLSITNAGGGTLNWTASSNRPWLRMSAGTGTAPASVTVSVNPAGLTAGTHSGTITVSAAGATNTPQAVSVTFVYGEPVTPPPPPTNLQPNTVAITTSPVTLRVNPIPGVIEYEFRIDYRRNDMWVYYYTYSSSTNTVTFWPQVAGTSYRWLARARNEGGWGDWSYDAVFWFNP